MVTIQTADERQITCCTSTESPSPCSSPEATPWAIAYERYQNPELNAFMSRAPELDFTQG